VTSDLRDPKLFTPWSETERDAHANKNECMCHRRAYDKTSVLRFITVSWSDRHAALLLLNKLD
jgi:hypothetical protein